jgi:hypothetical protein
MRPFFTVALLLAVLNISCTKSGVPLQSGGSLSSVERKNLVAIHPGFASWSPSQSAIWVRRGVSRHVCIRQGDIGSLSVSDEVVVFDGDGKVVEANVIQAPTSSNPKTVSRFSPICVTYERRDGKSVICSGGYSLPTCHHDFQKHMELHQRLQKVRESWHRSGSTNLEVMGQMFLNAIKTSNGWKPAVP